MLAVNLKVFLFFFSTAIITDSDAFHKIHPQTNLWVCGMKLNCNLSNCKMKLMHFCLIFFPPMIYDVIFYLTALQFLACIHMYDCLIGV